MDDEKTKSDRVTDPELKGPAEFDPEELKDHQTKEEKQAERVYRLLSTVDQGWKISIIRTQPSWCRGHLETIEIYEPGESIDTDYLIRTWGGQRIHIKVHNERGQWVGGGSISLFSYPPKVRGRELNESDFYGSLPVKAPSPPVMQNPYAPPPAAPLDMGALLGLLQKSKKEELAFALEILKRAPQNAGQVQAQPVQGAGSMMEQMISMFQMFGQMKEMFGGDGGAPAGDDLTGVIGDIAKNLFQAKNEVPKQTGGRALVAPRAVGRPGGPAPGSAPSGVPELRPVAPLENDTLSGIADKLSGLSAGDASEVLIQALGNMPEEKRNEAMTTFFQNMAGGEMEDPREILDDIENHDDTDLEGDNDHVSSGPPVKSDPASNTGG